MDANAFLSALSTLWVEFGITDQHVMLLEIVSFGENLDREILAFLTGKYIYSCTVKLYDILKVNNTVVKSVCYVTEHIICNLVHTTAIPSCYCKVS
jgi:hypothetical protein